MRPDLRMQKSPKSPLKDKEDFGIFKSVKEYSGQHSISKNYRSPSTSIIKYFLQRKFLSGLHTSARK